MPTDKKRQRQHRVRHEAGSSSDKTVPESQSLPSNDNVVEGNTSHINIATEDNTCNKRKPNEKPCTDQSNKQKNNGPTSRNKDGRIQIGVKNHQTTGTSKDNSKTDSNKSSSVAYAAEKEYESVSIMSSPQEPEKTPVQYQRRPVVSNWLKYEEMPPEFSVEEGEDYCLGEDYEEVLKLQGSTSNNDGYLQLKSELSWGKEDSKLLENHGLGSLKIVDLCSAIATIPYHQQLKIPLDILPINDVNIWNSVAVENKKCYDPNKVYTSSSTVNEDILASLRLTESELVVSFPKDKMKSEISNHFIGSSHADSVSLNSDNCLMEGISYPSNNNECGRSNFVSNLSQNNIDSSTNELKPKTFDFGLRSVVTENEAPLLCSKQTKAREQVSPTEETSGKDVNKITDKISCPEVSTIPPAVIVNNSEVEDLEDWLDSVLDD